MTEREQNEVLLALCDRRSVMNEAVNQVIHLVWFNIKDAESDEGKFAAKVQSYLYRQMAKYSENTHSLMEKIVEAPVND